MNTPFPPASLLILAVTIIASVAALRGSPRIIERSILRPYAFFRQNQYDRLITSGFVHADFQHLFFNMLSFYFFAFAMERTIGSARFLALYFAGMVLANLGTVYKHRNEPEYASLGASGAVLAVMFAAIVYFPHQSLSSFPFRCPFRHRFLPSAISFIAIILHASPRDRINHDAHIAGALVGLAFVAVTEPSAFNELAGMVGL